MEARAPFPGSPGPALVSQPIDTHPIHQVCLSLPTCPVVPKLKSPTSTPILHFCEGSPSPHTPSHPSDGQSWDLGKNPQMRQLVEPRLSEDTRDRLALLRCFRHSLLFG